MGLHARSTVCAVIPHYGCEAWLAQAVESLLDQSHPPDAVVVIDDGSPEPPRDVLAAYADVTLLAADDNGGPYRLVQAVIDTTDFDAYVFQDADDWSAPDRVEVLLAEAERTGAELIGSHELRVLVDHGEVVRVAYPLDVNAALDERPTSFPLLHPTSMVARSLAVRVGGFATGMRFSGDAEFLRRAACVARVVNADHFGYFRRKRSGSLSTSAATGLRSPARLAVHQELAARARANAERRGRGEAPDLRPWELAPPPALRHLAGPPINELSRRPRRRRPATPRRELARGRECEPIFAIGAPRSGLPLLTWALGQHPDLVPLPDARWLARVAGDLDDRATDDTAPPPPSFRSGLAAAVGALAAPDGRRWVAGGTGLAAIVHALVELFPGARFLHLVRDPEAVVESLLADPVDDGVFHTADLAWRRWAEATDAALAAEEALGANTVHRVRYRALISDPERTVQECLDFVGASFHPACVRPLASVAHDERAAAPRLESTAISAEAQALARRVLVDPPPAARPDGPAQLRRRYRRLAEATRGGGHGLVEKVRDVVHRAVPEGATVAVVSRGDPRLVSFVGRRGWHYPQVDDGTYAGHHPGSGDEAVSHLEALRSRGAEYLALPATDYWWLEHYTELRTHLAQYPVVAYQEDGCLVHRLAEDPPPHRTARWLPALVVAAGVPARGSYRP